MAASVEHIPTLILSKTKNPSQNNQHNSSLITICSEIAAKIQQFIHTLPDKQIKNLAEDGVQIDRINKGCNHEVLPEVFGSFLRILRVTVKKGKRELFHQHELPSVMLIFSAASIKLANAGEAFDNLPSFKSSAGFTIFIPFENSHAVENVDPQDDFGALRFEFKKEIAGTELQEKLVSLINEYKTKLILAALEYTNAHPPSDEHHTNNSKTTSFTAKK